MKYIILIINILFFLTSTFAQNTVNIDLNGSWKFQKGDNLKWAKPSFNTKDWGDIILPQWDWDPEYNGYGWVRKTFTLPAKEAYFLNLGQVDDQCEVYFNGKKLPAFVQQSQKNDQDTTEWKKYRMYYIPKESVEAKKLNTIAVRIRDDDGQGGIRYGNIFVSSTVFNNVLPVELRENWFKADGSNEWLAGFYDTMLAYKNKIWSYGQITSQGDSYTINIQSGDEREKIILRKEKDGYSIGSDENSLALCAKDLILAPLPASREISFSSVEDKAGVASISGLIRGYRPGKGGFAILQVLQNSGMNKGAEYRVQISSQGTFKISIPLSGSAFADIRFPEKNESSLIAISPGKSTLLVFDLEEYKIRYTEEYLGRERLTVFMGELAAENTIHQYIAALEGGGGEINEKLWAKLIYSVQRYVQLGNANTNPRHLNRFIHYIAGDYHKYNDTSALKSAAVWTKQLVNTYSGEHTFNSTYSLVLKALGEPVEGLKYLGKALQLADRDNDLNSKEAYQWRIKEAVKAVLKESEK